MRRRVGNAKQNSVFNQCNRCFSPGPCDLAISNAHFAWRFLRASSMQNHDMGLLISDAGSEFKKKVTNVCNALQIQQKYTAAHRAMGHGAVAIVNRTATDKIKAFAKEGKWYRRLQWAKLAYTTAACTKYCQKGALK